jgi:hypothetical protein
MPGTAEQIASRITHEAKKNRKESRRNTYIIIVCTVLCAVVGIFATYYI